MHCTRPAATVAAVGLLCLLLPAHGQITNAHTFYYKTTDGSGCWRGKGDLSTTNWVKLMTDCSLGGKKCSGHIANCKAGMCGANTGSAFQSYASTHPKWCSCKAPGGQGSVYFVPESGQSTHSAKCSETNECICKARDSNVYTKRNSGLCPFPVNNAKLCTMARRKLDQRATSLCGGKDAKVENSASFPQGCSCWNGRLYYNELASGVNCSKTTTCLCAQKDVVQALREVTPEELAAWAIVLVVLGGILFMFIGLNQLYNRFVKGSNK